ncbi:uncharacterized protein LOC121726806 [Aricia agestis]|uniref:uncharacterized protein LOC121726806 n=1 Tax=Aricia agestis TaxID=91739 RepID=UPI001C209D76|nr:uncharacterized protein LOC121726806 [Aricia agestis]
MEEIDVDLLISEVQSRPALWNDQDIDYYNVEEKKWLWEEVLDDMTDPYLSLAQRSVRGELIKNRWTVLRDNFVRERQKEIENNEKGITYYKTTQCEYYNRLMFLAPIVENKDNNTKDNNNTKQTNQQSESKKRSNRLHIDSMKVPPAKKSKDDNSVQKMVNVLKCAAEQLHEEDDADRQFLLCLVDDLKKVPRRSKSRVKMNILRYITEAQERDQTAEDRTKQIADENYTVITFT